MPRSSILVLFLVVAMKATTAQCTPDSLRLHCFHYYDGFKNPTVFYLDPPYRWAEEFIKDEKRFFDSLGVITFSNALNVGCSHGLVACFAYLEEDKSAWSLIGPELKRRYGIMGDFYYKYQCRTIRLDPRTGKVKSDRKRWYTRPNRD